MDPREIAKMKRKVKALQKQMGEIGPVMRGSIVFIGNQKKYSHFSLNKDKKTHLIYLGGKSGRSEPKNTRRITRDCLTSLRK